MIVSKFISSVISAGKRKYKAVLFGKYEVREAAECAPYGWDSNPVAGASVVYGKTTSRNSDIIIGTINTQQFAEVGESRFYSTDASGTFKANIWARSTGDILIGTSNNPSDYINHATQYEALNTKLQDQITKINAQLDSIASGITGVGGSYVPTHIVEDFSSAKLNNIKTQ